MLHTPQFHFRKMRREQQRRDRIEERTKVLIELGIDDWSSAWAISSFLEQKCDEARRNGLHNEE